MSSKGYINVSVRIDDGVDADVELIARTLNEAGGHGRWDMWEAQAGALFFGGDGSWLETETERVLQELAQLQDRFGIPDTRWRAEFAYESFEDASSDGALVQFEVRDGKITDWKQSVVAMEDATPWFDISVEHDGDKVIPAKRYEEEVVEPVLEAMLPALHRTCNKLLRRYGFPPIPQDEWVALVDADDAGKVAEFRDACVELMREAGLHVESDGTDF